MRGGWAVCALLVVGACAACSEKKSASKTSGQALASRAETPKAGQPVTPTAAKPAVSQQDLQALVDRWVLAQNEGDFATYESLYARRMIGIKRVGKRTFTMDRAKWMQDRRRMFAKPMGVGATELTFAARGKGMAVELTQEWSQGKFRDRGRKRLTLTLEDGLVRIAHEEMLSSEIATDLTELSTTVLPVLRIDDQPYVLVRELGDPSWGAGPIVVTKTDVDVVVLQNTTEQLPEEIAAWRQRALTVYASDGTTCDANVQELRLYAGAFGSFLVDAGETDPVDPIAYGQQVFAKQRPSVVARLDRCRGAFARPKPLAAAVVFPLRELDPALEQRALTAARDLPYFHEMERAWLALLEGTDLTPEEAAAEVAKDPWPEGENVNMFGREGGRQFITVYMTASGCGTVLSADMFAVFEIGATGALTLLNESVGGVGFLPTLLLDADGDADLEIMSGNEGGYDLGLYTIQLGSVAQVSYLRYFLGHCGC